MALVAMRDNEWDFCRDLSVRVNRLRRRLEVSFDPFIKAAVKQDNPDWSFVVNVIDNYQDELSIFYALKEFCEFVLKLFLRFDCKDQQLMIKIIYMYHKVLAEYFTYGNRCNAGCRRCHEVDLTAAFMNSVIVEDDEMFEIYKFSNTYTYLQLVYLQFFQLMISEDCTFLQFLVKYGLINFQENMTEDIVLGLQVMYDIYIFLKPDKADDVKFDDAEISDLLRNIKNPNSTRLLLTVGAMIISMGNLVKSEFIPIPVLAKCFNFISLTAPEAAISLKDVENMLDLVFPNDKNFISDVSFSFKEVFPESPVLPSPRSLKHLCRHKIRNCISKSPSLTAAVSETDTPGSLKNYVLFLDD